jgi:hypothetical protein
MAAMSDFLENKIVDFIFRGQALGITGASATAGSGPTNLYVGLYTVNPSDTGGGTEVSGAGYTRVTISSSLANWAGTQAAASTVASSGNTGTTSNNGAITFGTPGANWGSITGFGIFDAVTAGNLLIWGALTTPKTVNNGDAAPAFSPAALSIQIDN